MSPSPFVDLWTASEGINIDTAANPILINSRFAYVALSRASLDAEIYINDSTGLGQELRKDIVKTAAVEISHSKAVIDSGLGQSA